MFGWYFIMSATQKRKMQFDVVDLWIQIRDVVI